MDTPLNGAMPVRREFFSGQPIWKINGMYSSEPWGLVRMVDPQSGAFYWSESGEETAAEEDLGQRLWDTEAFWNLNLEGGAPSATWQPVDYGAQSEDFGSGWAVAGPSDSR